MTEGKMFHLRKIYDEMSKKKRVACLIPILAIILIVIMYIQGSNKVIFRNGTFTGITSEEIERNDETPVFQNTTMKITSLDVHEDVDISGKISTTDGDVKFHFTGDLYVSKKQNQGIESYVGQIVDRKNNFVVNYFEIKNDTNYDLLKYSEENCNKRIISFDLERNGINYYFELDMDTLAVSFNAKSITKMAPSEIDFYENYVNEEKSVAPCIIPYDSEENQITGANNIKDYLATGERWYYKQVINSWFCSEIIYEYYAEPKVKGTIINVGTAGSSHWSSKLIFDAYVKKDGIRIDTEYNVFSIASNLDKQIEFQIYPGENTIFSSGHFEGICNIDGVENNYREERSFVLNNSNDGIANNYIVSQLFNTSISLEANHFILFSGFVGTVDSAKTENEETNCMIRWSYQMCYQKKGLENGSSTIEQTIPYITNGKA